MSTPDAPPPHPSSFPGTGAFMGSITVEPPSVVFWFKLYAAALALWNLLFVPVGLILFVLAMSVGEDAAIAALLFPSLILAALAFLFATLFVLPIILKPRPWVWIYSLVIIVVTMPGLCCFPFAILLLIFWIGEDNRFFYGMSK